MALELLRQQWPCSVRCGARGAPCPRAGIPSPPVLQVPSSRTRQRGGRAGSTVPSVALHTGTWGGRGLVMAQPPSCVCTRGAWQWCWAGLWERDARVMALCPNPSVQQGRRGAVALGAAPCCGWVRGGSQWGGGLCAATPCRGSTVAFLLPCATTCRLFREALGRIVMRQLLPVVGARSEGLWCRMAPWGGGRGDMGWRCTLPCWQHPWP